MSEPVSGDQGCKICGVIEKEHMEFAHEFSRDGQLRKKETKTANPRAVVMVDSHLRKILVRKGILTAEDFLE